MKFPFYELVEVVLNEENKVGMNVLLCSRYEPGWTYERFFSMVSIFESNSSNNQ